MKYDDDDLMRARGEGALAASLPTVGALMELGAQIGDEDLQSASIVLLGLMADRLGMPADDLMAAMGAAKDAARFE
jgi:hypothetical protein